ncbi:hypothetical protein AMJ86_02515 [bacterium SM23_57]|nr:MAG: hypothetical protein AMJ86_02515 [bacterium SM23_57]
MNTDRRIVILTEGQFSNHTSKTANGVIRFIPEQVVAIIDSTKAGKTTAEVIGAGGDIPVVASLEEALPYEPTALLIGIAPPGGMLPDSFKDVIRQAVENRLDILNGLHTFLGDDRELAALAERFEVRIVDYRRPPKQLQIASMRWKERRAKVVLGVGIDANIGKMSTAIALWKDFQSRGYRADFIATGQTGMVIADKGISVDALPSDFVSGAIEDMVMDSAKDHDIIFVEGQGSLVHQGYSAVAVGIMHGAMPDAMILSLEANRQQNDFDMPYPDVWDVIRLHKDMISVYRPTVMAGISLVTFGLDEEAALEGIKNTERDTGLPTTDPLRFGARPLSDAILARLSIST